MSPFFVLVGPPGAGTATLFSAFTGAYAATFEYPGTAVQLAEGTVWMDSRWARVVDTPAVSSFLCPAEADRVTRDLLLAIPGAVAIVVADTRDLEHALVLVLELAELAVPLALCLNRVDESAPVPPTDEADLSRRLGVPVVSIAATRSEGIDALRSALAHAAVPILQVDYGTQVESAIAFVVRALGNGRRTRGLALLLLAGDETARPWIEARAGAGALVHVADLTDTLARATGFLPKIVADVRIRAARRIARSVQEPWGVRGRLRVSLERVVARLAAPLRRR